VGDAPIVGLTGGIASGKSAVAAVLREQGIPVVDADQVAREVVAPGSEGLQEVVAAFGHDVLAPDGSLDRDALAQQVFADADARKRLEAITHPRIARVSFERLAALRASGAPYVVYEAPLLVETGAHRNLAALIVVVTGEDEQVQRVIARDRSTAAAARARIAAQLPLAAKVAAATHVIHNDATLDVLRERTLAVHRALLNELRD